MEIKRVGIVGSGTMGSRIAFQCGRCGKGVNLYDIEPEALDTAMAHIKTWHQEHLEPDEAEKAFSFVRRCDDLAECLSDVDIVIENVPENLEIKRKVFAEMDRLAPAHVLLCTNSSSLPSSRLADATNRPDKVFNANFGDPREDQLVEVMFHVDVSEETKTAGEEFLKSIKMVPIITEKEIMGFSFNRTWRAIKREVLHLVGDGYSHFEEIDRAWIMLFGTKWGPFGLMDDVGLDVIRDIENQYYADSGEDRDKPPQFLEDMIARGRIGSKSGRGFYNHPNPEYQQEGWLKKELPWTPDKKIRFDD
ncbi:3-hydroxyacyl-CoA dehydrogenase family protein [Acidobacteriota bacterium]